jgi:hypothetical protein
MNPNHSDLGWVEAGALVLAYLVVCLVFALARGAFGFLRRLWRRF